MVRKSWVEMLALLLAIGGVAIGGVALLSAKDRVAVETDPSLYAKKDTWAETMLAVRAGHARAAGTEKQAAAGVTVGAMVKPFETDSLRGDGPGQQVSVSVAGQRWMRLIGKLEQGVGNCNIWGDAKLTAKDGSVTWLGALKPVSVQVGWGELLVDKNWENKPLQIKDKKFEHGIWVHTDSDVCYLLDGKYEKFEAWVGIDANRATGAARFKVVFDGPEFESAVWKMVGRDFPQQMKDFEKDAGKNAQAWLKQGNNTNIERGIINRIVADLGPQGDAIKKQLDDLSRAKSSPDDPRWLNLYAQGCRWRDCRAPLERIWIGDLRRAFEKQFAELQTAQAPADDKRWDALKTKAERAAGALKSSSETDLATARASIEALAKALPDRFGGADSLLADFDAKNRVWQNVFASAARGEDDALKKLATVSEDIQKIRRSSLLMLRGMRDFLSAPVNANIEKEWNQQYAGLLSDLGNRAHFAKVTSETLRPEALIMESDRDPLDVTLRRTAALLSDLKRAASSTASSTAFAAYEKELADLQQAQHAIDVKNSEARYLLFADASRLRRQIAFANPLLDFDKILFIKRHRALYNHMCDQYYGMAATPGGGLYVLSNPFGPNPQLRDVLANSEVQNGRLKGQKLSGGPNKPPALSFDGMGNLHGPEYEGGTFLSPELSYDGKSILFAYVEGKGDRNHRHHTDPTQGHWDEGHCYHVFKVNLDGSDLRQLTDGTFNDFDPCWLPNGRIAFISERRGGYLRCGRACPLYSLFDMAADGNGITCLSFHETNEWHPSVTNDGRIVYTRWDYVDRHGCTAHHPWITTLDGRDARQVQGNFAPRPTRPDMELDVRAIPGSHKFVATAAPHHGQAYGSLVMIDPRVFDDDTMAPVKRVTPEVGFPESQGGRQVYGTPWPLSENYFLCVYDELMQAEKGTQGSGYLPGNYGIYLVDVFGNKELIYRDPEIACLSPMPARPRPMPAVMPDMDKRGPETNPAARIAAKTDGKTPDGKSPEGVLTLVNVYDSLKPWPEGTKIKSLRVLQVLPMSVPSGGPPHETAMRQPNSMDSVVPVRQVLGTVPVEEDGSAYFAVPANKEIFFQALDENELAVQSMRSGTYLHEDETLSCVGCHERGKQSAPAAMKKQVMATLREPSRLKPDVDGSYPFSYPRLVQPVLDKNCAECHAKNVGKAPNLGRQPLVRNWYASYASLVPKYAYINYADGYRTTPGKFGAQASALYAMLKKGHHDVKLSAEDMHRITLWLDCVSMFYGVYEREGGQAQLRGEIAKPTLE
ncbi:MAG: NPCBM/NEW2 domain-containing protein [Candidatus Sumerlaeota bacterium]|nr:NPCBM/NEW2 domain-containing protein [Candidatus Sumerlaeota bacterium]